MLQSYINPPPPRACPCGSKWSHPRVNNLLYLYYNEENNYIQKHSLKREFFIFCVKQCEVIFFLNSATHAPGVQTGQAPEPGVISSLTNKTVQIRRAFTGPLVLWFVFHYISVFLVQARNSKNRILYKIAL